MRVLLAVSLLALGACSIKDDQAWQAPLSPCNYAVSSKNGVVSIDHDYCASEVSLLSTINQPRCITCEAWEIDPRRRDDRNDDVRTK